MSVRYIGPHDCVVVPLPLGGEAEVEQGRAMRSTPEHEAALLEQPANWERVEKVQPQKQEKTAPAAPATEKPKTEEEKA